MNIHDLSLYLVTDRPLSHGRDLEWIVDQAVQGGVTMVQLREKDCSTRKFIELAQRLKQCLMPLHIPLIINDRIDVTLAADADGIHIGQSDMPWEMARSVLGPNKIIGLSVETVPQALEANGYDVDYLGLSPVFATQTKHDVAPALGLDGVRQIAAFSRHALVGIGGMNQATAASVIEAGAHGVAVVSAIVGAESPMEASKELKQIVEHALNLRKS